MGSEAFYEAIASRPWVTAVRHSLYAVVGVLGLAVVGTVFRWAGDPVPVWAGWGTSVGALAFSVTALDSARLAVLAPARAAEFVGSASATRQLLAATELIVRLDPYTWIRFGALALWFAAAAVALSRSGARWLGTLAAILCVILLATVVLLTLGEREYLLIVTGPSVLLLPCVVLLAGSPDATVAHWPPPARVT